jgi:hypothetical protein
VLSREIQPDSATATISAGPLTIKRRGPEEPYERLLVAVWNPSYAGDAMGATIELLLNAGRPMMMLGTN